MPEERVDRRLAAIWAGDIAGYSRLMGVDEEGTLRQIKAHRKELVDPKITEHRGRIVKTTGDGMLVEFVSVVDAVRCAVDIQRGMVDRNASIPADRRIEFRIGLNVGDIIIDGDDIFGDGVRRLPNRSSSHIRQLVDKLVERDRVVAHSHAGSVVDRVGNGRSDPANTKLADALSFHRRRSRIDLIKEDRLLMRDIRMYWHFVAGKIMVDKKTEALVDYQFLHQRRAGTHGHRADHLAAR